MFYVFGINGPMYRGGHERLSQIAPVRRTPRAQALATRTHLQEHQPPSPAPEEPPAPAATRGAVAAYASTADGLDTGRKPLTQVHEVMTRGAVTVSARARVNDAWQTMAQRQIGQAPVLNDAGHVVGLLMRADMAPLDLLPEPGAVRDAIALARRPVADVMLSPVPAVDASTDLRRVASVLLETALPGLPVTNDAGILVGFVSRTDLLKAIASDPPLDLWS